MIKRVAFGATSSRPIPSRSQPHPRRRSSPRQLTRVEGSDVFVIRATGSPPPQPGILLAEMLLDFTREGPVDVAFAGDTEGRMADLLDGSIG